MKLIVETTGEFQLKGQTPEEFARHDRPSIVQNTSFIGFHTSRGAVRVLGQVADTATDADFADQWAECSGDKELAVSNYATQHVYPAVEPEVEPDKKAKAAKA